MLCHAVFQLKEHCGFESLNWRYNAQFVELVHLQETESTEANVKLKHVTLDIHE